MRERSDFYGELGLKIEAKRKQRRLSRRALGERVGKHRNIIHRWEWGAPMGLHDFLRLCEALSMPHTMMLPGAELPAGMLLRQLVRERDGSKAGLR